MCPLFVTIVARLHKRLRLRGRRVCVFYFCILYYMHAVMQLGIELLNVALHLLAVQGGGRIFCQGMKTAFGAVPLNALLAAL